MLRFAFVVWSLFLWVAAVRAEPPTREEAIALLQPYAGPSTAGVDCSTLHGKIMCGYQGWFTAPGDGSQRGLDALRRPGDQFEPGLATLTCGPTSSELDDDEKFATPFRHARTADGSPVFSSHIRKTVLRHFRWMQEYGDRRRLRAAVRRRDLSLQPTCGIATPSWPTAAKGPTAPAAAYAVMYDLSGLREGGRSTRSSTIGNCWSIACNIGKDDQR